MTTTTLETAIRAMSEVELPEYVGRVGVTVGNGGRYAHASICIGKRDEFVSSNIDDRDPAIIAAELLDKIEAKRRDLTEVFNAAEAEFGPHFASIAA